MAAYIAPARLVVFVGSYTKPMGHCPAARGEGVTAYACDEATGALTPLGPPAALENPSFLCLGPPHLGWGTVRRTNSTGARGVRGGPLSPLAPRLEVRGVRLLRPDRKALNDGPDR